MPNYPNKRKSEIKKRKLNLNCLNKKTNKSEKKFIKKDNKKPDKIILDYEDEEEEIHAKVNVSQNSKKLKPIMYQKEEFSYFDSFSTNRTEGIQKAKSVMKQKKKNVDQKNKKATSIEKKKYSDVIIEEKEFESPKKGKNKSQNKSQNKKKTKKKSNTKKTNKSQNKKQYQKKYNFHINLENPFYEGEDNAKGDDDKDSDVKSNEASKDSDYEIEKKVRKRKAYSTRKRISNKKTNRKGKLNIQDDIEMKDYTCNKLEYDSKKSILGNDYLPCREKEQKIIYDYIQEGLQTNGNYNSLYIAGMPGTGKTACVKTVINIIESEYEKNNNNKYKKKSKEKYLTPFTKLFLCGTEFPTISNVYKTIYKFIFSNTKGINIKKCTQSLNNFFSNRKNFNIAQLNDPSNSHIILVIDEIDFLINRNQNLLYNIFNWTTYEESKLIVISISNTLYLPNRLAPKIKSRMGNNKIMFKPYNKDELIIIIKSKGIEFENFTKDAIKLSCMKVAAINGDLRRIIQILTRAKEIYKLDAKKSKDKTIDKNYILRACEELFNSKLIKVFQSLQISEKIIICSILSYIKDNNDNKIKISKLYDKKDIFI